MTMADKDLDKRLVASLRTTDVRSVPPFATVWAAAEQRYRQTRLQRRALAAAAVLAVAVSLAIFFARPEDPVPPYVGVAELLDSTHWTAPSDTLLPVREIDLYNELPAVLESTESGEGALL